MTTSTSQSNSLPSLRPARICFAQTLALLLLGILPLPLGWAKARAILDSARSTEQNRAEREASAGGYYEGLIGGEGDSTGRSELALALLGKPVEWTRFDASNVMQDLPDGDFLQFQLKANIDKVLFKQVFTTNKHGMRDREYAVKKPAGTFRIAVIGSSMDMGWGISTEETYVNLLEDWLNQRAKPGQKYEVLNFAVAAYSPLQRLETYRRKVREFQPDLVIYSATMLDTRLMEIHLCDIFQDQANLSYDFLRARVVAAGLTDEDLTVDADRRLIHKDIVKKKLRPEYWAIYDDALGELAAMCRSDGAALACVVIPRVGKADAPPERAEPVARLRGMAAHHAIPLLDLSPVFDGEDPARYEIAPWDDHPNARGHLHLFRGLARALLEDQALRALLFPDDAAPRPAGGVAPAIDPDPKNP